MNPVLEAARKKRVKAQEKLDALLAIPTEEARALSDDEADRFEEIATSIKKLSRQIEGLEAEAARAAKVESAAATSGQDGTAPARVKRENMTYAEGGSNSYFRDLATIASATIEPSLSGEAEDAVRRMRQHGKEMAIEARHDADLARRLADGKFVSRDYVRSEMEKRVNPNTTDGTGGEFVPPTWLVSQYIPFVRPTRTFANRVKNMPLPPGTDQINLPKITTGSLTGVQTSQGSAVTSQDIVTATVSASVRTIAGQEDISYQLLEQSPIAMDNVIFDDLSRDYDQRLDVQIVSGSGASGQHKGVLAITQATSNTDIQKANGVTVSSATFDASAAGGQFRSIVNGVNAIEVNRIAAPTAIWVHPRRANSWGATAVDSTNRLLFIPAKYGNFNSYGVNEGSPTPEGVAGELYGLSVVKDANMSTTMNGTATTGGTADAVVVLKEDDLYLWEGTLRMRALPEILSGTLQIRFQLYAYSAFMPDRFPCAVSILTGNTGLAAPTF